MRRCSQGQCNAVESGIHGYSHTCGDTGRPKQCRPKQCMQSAGRGCSLGTKGQQGGAAAGAPLGIFPMGLISGLAVSGFSYLHTWLESEKAKEWK